jgi:hypothetical protein
MNKLDKYYYDQFINHLKNKGIDYEEEKDIDIEEWFEEYVIVKPMNSRMKERYFSTDGGCQLH